MTCKFAPCPTRWRWLVAITAVVNGRGGRTDRISPDILNGPPVMNGSARGTGAVMASSRRLRSVARHGTPCAAVASAGRHARSSRLPRLQRRTVPLRDAVQSAVPVYCGSFSLALRRGEHSRSTLARVWERSQNVPARGPSRCTRGWSSCSTRSRGSGSGPRARRPYPPAFLAARADDESDLCSGPVVLAARRRHRRVDAVARRPLGSCWAGRISSTG